MGSLLAGTFHMADAAGELSHTICRKADELYDTHFDRSKTSVAFTAGMMTLHGTAAHYIQAAVGTGTTLATMVPALAIGASAAMFVSPGKRLGASAHVIGAGLTAITAGVIGVTPTHLVTGAAAVAATGAAIVLTGKVADMISDVTQDDRHGISDDFKEICGAIGASMMLAFALNAGGAAAYGTHKLLATPTVANANTSAQVQAIPAPRAQQP